MKPGINRNSRLMTAGMEGESDAQLLQGLRQGNDAIIARLYKKYYVMVLKMVLANNGSEDEARDVYQDTMIVLHENVSRREFTLTCALQTYIYSVARRLWLKQLKRAGRFTLIREEEDRDVADAGQIVEEFLEKESEIAKMHSSLGKLGEPCATLISDFYVNGLSMEQIAEKFGYTNADNAKNQKYKCLQRLKRLFFEKAGITNED
jgi:RNA polymerase sigma factor (sigma-70 family)